MLSSMGGLSSASSFFFIPLSSSIILGRSSLSAFSKAITSLFVVLIKPLKISFLIPGQTLSARSRACAYCSARLTCFSLLPISLAIRSLVLSLSSGWSFCPPGANLPFSSRCFQFVSRQNSVCRANRPSARHSDCACQADSCRSKQ